MPRRDRVADLAVEVAADTEQLAEDLERELEEESEEAGRRAGSRFGEEFSDRAERKTDVDLDESVEAGAAGAAAGETYADAFEARAEEVDLSDADLDLDVDAAELNRLPTRLEATGSAADEAGDAIDEMVEDEDVGRIRNLSNEVHVLRVALEAFRSLPAAGQAGVLGGLGALLGGTVAGGATVAGAILSGRLSEQLEELQALLPGVKENMAGIRAEIAIMAEQTGEFPRTLAKGLTQAAQQTDNLDQAMRALRSATQLKAIGAFDDLEKSMDALLTASRALPGGFENIEQAAGSLLVTTRRANASFEQTLTAFEELGPLASQNGVSIEQLSAAWATLTQEGFTAEQATQHLRSRLEGLDAAQGEVRGSTLLAAGAMDTYRKNLQKTREATEATSKAVRDLEDDFLRQAKILGQNIAEELRQLGDSVLPGITAQLKAWNQEMEEGAGPAEQIQDRLSNVRAEFGGLLEATEKLNDAVTIGEGLVNEEALRDSIGVLKGLTSSLQALSALAQGDVRAALREAKKGGREMAGGAFGIQMSASRRLAELAALDLPQLEGLGREGLREARRTVESRIGELQSIAVQATREDDPETIRKAKQAFQGQRQVLNRINDLLSEQQDRQEAIRAAAEDRLSVAKDRLQSLEATLQAEARARSGIDVPGLRPDGPTQPLDTADTQAAMRELEPMLQETGTTAANVQEILDEYGVTLDELAQEQGKAGKRAKQAALAIMGFGERSEESEEKTSDLRDTIRDVSRAASGVLELAQAMGVVDEKTGQALQSMTQLAASAAQFASGNIAAGIASGASGLAGIVGMMLQDPRQQVIHANTEALLALKQDLEKLRAAIQSTPGDIMATLDEFEQAIEKFPDPENPMSSETAGSFFGNEDSDPFSAPEATGSEVRSFVQRMGLTWEEFKQQAQRMGVSIESMVKAVKKGEAPMSAVRQEVRAFTKAMKELQMEKLFKGFQGQLEKFQDRMALFDIEDPIKKLEKFREILLSFVDLPDEMESMARGFNLQTVAGRKAFEQWIQNQWKRLASGQLTAEQLGGLTPQQFREQLKRMEDLVDQAAEGEGSGSTSAFQVSRQITEVTGNRIVGVLTTLSVLARQRNRMVMGIAQKMGASVPESIRPPSRPQGGAGTTVNREGDIVLQMPKGAVVIEADGRLTRKDGEEAAHGFVDVIDRRLGSVTAGEERREGEV